MDFFLRPQSKAESVITINPKPEFVIKSKLASVQNRPLDLPFLEAGAKVFINLCHDPQVPKPDVDFDPAIVYPLIINDQWEIPIITSSVRQDKDKKGALCYVWDCCINSKCVQWIRKEYQLREIVVEWCLESCDLCELIEISRDKITFPKLKSKGSIAPLEILSEDLNNDYKKEMTKILKEDRDEPRDLIEIRRNLMDDEEKAALAGAELPPLIPRNAAAKSSKPLIEEVDALSIEDKKCKKLNDVHFQVNMSKESGNHKLRIDIISELNSAKNYEVQYNPSSNELVIKNTNLQEFNEKILTIPLPDIFVDVESQMQCSFIKSEKKLSIKI
ncbi:PIH1 (YHR034C) [Zygosaccharomyces parabailii]|nr:PIH1 (YHR034C) [Zygosaccharomyces parabailii]CDH17977.1 related to Protein interacting with Hsp90 1 [Zygosaccharomyces bailii ISA1307]SJM83772.1 related to protein interacting with Hsp90 1 [Zygosaccharomyces bailii]